MDYSKWDDLEDSDEEADSQQPQPIFDPLKFDAPLAGAPEGDVLKICGDGPGTTLGEDMLTDTLLGYYHKEEGLVVNGEPVFNNEDGRILQLWRNAGGGWQIGYSRDCGKNSALLSASADAKSDGEFCSGWRIANSKRRWIDAPELRCLTLA